MFSKILFVLSALSVITSAFPHVERAAELVPLSSVGGVGAVQTTTSDTRLYYQNSDGSISEYGITNTFSAGRRSSNGVLVPAGQAQIGTPIVATTLGSADFKEIHVYFFSPDNILSEWIWQPGGWRGGPTCTDCLTVSKFPVSPGSKILYAMQNPSATGSLRVGFVSAKFPGTLSEADKSGSGWQLAPLPN
ncbi:hypothetical protein BD779DRAFT_1466044 [Infundibulicybe gibba]|nr:hypothetical protein BD779DRAFT_1466044 [Infundibulicybe gibba]